MAEMKRKGTQKQYSHSYRDEEEVGKGHRGCLEDDTASGGAEKTMLSYIFSKRYERYGRGLRGWYC